MNKVRQYTKDDLYLPDVMVDAVDYARLESELREWHDVFGHLGAPDEASIAIHTARYELEVELTKWRALAEASQTIAKIAQSGSQRMAKIAAQQAAPEMLEVVKRPPEMQVVESIGNWHLLYDQHVVGDTCVHEFRIQRITNDIALYPGITLEEAIRRFRERVAEAENE
jgi:hypothetical protein